MFKHTFTCMATKTITIKKEAYERLKKLKNERSFSQLILDMTEDKDPNLMESFGVLSDEEARKFRENREKFREKFNKDADEELRT